MSEPIWKQPAWLQAVAAVIIAVTALIGGVVAVLQFITPKPNDVLEKKNSYTILQLINATSIKIW